MTATFTPILYLKAGCPHCFKLRLFLVEAGLIGEFAVREFVPGDAAEEAIRVELAPHFAKVTFPAVQYAPGAFQSESNDIIARYAGESGVDPAGLSLLSIYIDRLMPRLAQQRVLQRRVDELEAAQSALLTNSTPGP